MKKIMNVILICALLAFSGLSEYIIGQNTHFINNPKKCYFKYAGTWKLIEVGAENTINLVPENYLIGTKDGFKMCNNLGNDCEEFIQVNGTTFKSNALTIVFKNEKEFLMEVKGIKFKGIKIR